MVTVFAKLTAYADSVEKVVEEIEKVIPLTREEAGCVDYQICQGIENPECFYGYEVFESMDAFQVHISSKHFTDLIHALDGTLALEPEITIAEPL